ncbi:hypothetical protein [Novosphingobium sp.]
MKTTIRRVFALTLLTAGFGLAACHDGHPDRGDHHPHDHYQNH